MCMSNACFINGNTSGVSELISFVNSEQYQKLDDAWLGLIESNNNNLSALFEVVDLLIKREEKNRAHDFLMTLTPHYKQKGRYQDVLEILKKLLEYNPKKKELAKEIAECYLNIYKDRPYAKDLIEKTCPETTDDIKNAMKMIERHFYLDRGDYVFHKSWGVGEVVSIDTSSEKVHINFEKKSNHSVAIDIAPDILLKLDNDDLLVMIFARKDELQKIVNEKPVDLIKLTLKYFKGKASVSQVKNRLITCVIPPEAWSRWWTSTKKLLKKDPYIKLSEGTPTTSFLELRTTPMTHHQEILERLNGTKDLDKKIEITKKYVSEMKSTEVCKETLIQLSNVFKKEADQWHETNPAVAVECLILLEELQDTLKAEPGKYKNEFEMRISTNNNLAELVEAIGILEYKKYVLDVIKKVRPEKWQEEFARLFFMNSGNLWEFIIKELITENKQHAIEEVALKAFNHFNAYPEHYIWFCKNGMHGRYPELYKHVDPAIMFNRLIELLDNLYFKIQKGRDGDFKAMVNKIKNLLEDKGTDYAIHILNDANAESIFSVVSSSKGLEDWFKVSIESVIQDRYPDLFEKPGHPKLDENKIYATKEGYDRKKKEFDHLMNVEFPENARDLGEAISRGDLRENAEYKAAREKQAMLVEKAERMKAELQRVVILDLHSIHPDAALPGTRVTIKHQGKTELETYTILGPWDVDIEKGVISYLSPIGKGLLHKTAGETVTIKLPEGESVYEILKIEKA